MCARLDAVLAALATAPLPVLPSAAERQVISAIDAESGVRASATRLPMIREESAPAGRPRATAGPRATATDGHGRRWARSWSARVGVTASLVALLASLGYLVRGVGAGSSAQAISSSSAGTAPVLLPVGHLSGTYASATRPGVPLMPQPETGQPGPPPHATVAFLVTDTGTKYRRSTLRAQVRRRLAVKVHPPAVVPIQPVTTPVTSASGAAAHPKTRISAGNPHSAHPPAPAEVAPPESLIGCVMHLTRNVLPKFVDRATYQARPAYVFADADEAWVVGIDCTAARPALITAVRLGNVS